jgi:catechol 2,3-dioxygenase-like lactoylglutathione lyase family enzyme
VVPLHDENRIFVKHGLSRLRQQPPLGLRVLLEAAGLPTGAGLRASDIGYKLAPRLNAAGRLYRADAGVELLLTQDAERARAFFRDVLGFSAVDAGGGWLIFALPPAELAAHPAEQGSRHELYLMCDDVHATVEELRAKGVEFTRPVSDERFGLVTALRVPGGGELGLYEPRHPSPIV